MKQIITLLTAIFLVSNVYGQTATEYCIRGNAKGRLQDYRGAIADFNRAIELNPNLALTYYNRGLSKYKLQDYRGAIADYNKEIELNPNFEEAYYNRGLSKYELQDYRGAIADYAKAIKLNPNHAKAYNNRGYAKILLGQKKADKDYENDNLLWISILSCIRHTNISPSEDIINILTLWNGNGPKENHMSVLED
jgi:tetratricopeptide (TPR) repeat protein